MAELFVILNCCIIPIFIPRELELKGTCNLRKYHLLTFTNEFQNKIMNKNEHYQF